MAKSNWAAILAKFRKSGKIHLSLDQIAMKCKSEGWQVLSIALISAVLHTEITE
jgi:hypothetical protein